MDINIVNPHVIPFLRKSIAESPLHRAGAWMMNLAVQELQHRLAQVYSCIFNI
jgi:hypothetical protein